MLRPFHRGGGGYRDAIRGRRQGTGRELEMLESLLALRGLVLLRGEGRRHRGFGAGQKRGKWKGRAIGHSLGVEVSSGS